MTKEYPDFVHHVGMGYADGRKNVPWCGAETFGPGEPFFQDPTHAALNGHHKGRLVACPECVKAINAALCNGHDDIDGDRHGNG